MDSDAVPDLQSALAACTSACDSAMLLLEACQSFAKDPSSRAQLVLKRRATVVDSVKIKAAHSQLRQYQEKQARAQRDGMAEPYNRALLEARRACEDRDAAEREIASILAPTLFPRVRILKTALTEYNDGCLLKYVSQTSAGQLPALVWISLLFRDGTEAFDHVVPLLTLELKTRLSRRIECEVLEGVRDVMAKERDKWRDRSNAVALFLEKDFARQLERANRDRALDSWYALRSAADLDKDYITGDASHAAKGANGGADAGADYCNSDREYDENAHDDSERDDIESDDASGDESRLDQGTQHGTRAVSKDNSGDGASNDGDSQNTNSECTGHKNSGDEDIPMTTNDDDVDMADDHNDAPN